MSWTISKEFEFDYGHRVYTQELNVELSLDSCLACRHLHGHRGKIGVHLQADELDNRGMVIDFKELNWFKKWVDDVLDHKMILSINDPVLKTLFPIFANRDFNDGRTFDNLFQVHGDGYYTVWLQNYTHGTPEAEIYEGLVLVDFVPTSENLSKWIYNIVNSKIGHLCKVQRIEFNETPKSKSVFS